MAGAIGPIDYSTGADSPLQAFNQGLTVGNTAINSQLQQQQLQLQLNQQRAYQADIQAVGANPTPQNIAGLSLKYPQLSGNIKQSFDMLNENDQKAKLDIAIPNYARALNGDYAGLADNLNKQADAFASAGRQADAASARTMATLVTNHPEQARVLLGLPLAAAMGPDKFASTFATVGAETRANEKQPAEVLQGQSAATIAAAKANVAPVVEGAGASSAVSEAITKGEVAKNAPQVQTAEATQKTADATKAAIEAGATPQIIAQTKANIDSQIQERANNFGLGKDRLAAETALKVQELRQKDPTIIPPPSAIKIINDSSAKSIAATEFATKLNSIADQTEAAPNTWTNPQGGKLRSIGDVVNNTLGVTNGAQMLNAEYARLRSQAIAGSMPAGIGRITDSDIRVFGAGIPDANASPEQKVAFLRTMAKYQQVEALRNDAMAEWANQVGHMGTPKRDINIDGIDVAAGTSFAKFLPTYVNDRLPTLQQNTAKSTIQGRGYYKYATPQGQ